MIRGRVSGVLPTEADENPLYLPAMASRGFLHLFDEKLLLEQRERFPMNMADFANTPMLESELRWHLRHTSVRKIDGDEIDFQREPGPYAPTPLLCL